MQKLTLDIVLILTAAALGLGIWGYGYALRVYKNPMLKTYVSVFRGVGIPQVASALLTWFVLWRLGYFWELGWIVLIPLGAIGIPAIPIIYSQEKKYREQLDG